MYLYSLLSAEDMMMSNNKHGLFSLMNLESLMGNEHQPNNHQRGKKHI